MATRELSPVDLVVAAPDESRTTIRDEASGVEVQIETPERIDAPEAEEISRAVFLALHAGPEGVDV